MDSLKKLVADPVRIDLAGERIEIKPIKVKHLPSVLKTARPFLDDLKNLFESLPDASEAEIKRIMAKFLLEGSAQLVDAVIGLTAICLGKDKSWVEELDIDELVFVFGKLIEVNGDFLAQRVLPAFTSAVGGVIETVLGQTQSTDSLEQDTE